MTMNTPFFAAAKSGNKTAFVLAGGGSLGAVQVGMLKALLAHGVTPDLVVGASAGAINGAYLAGRPNTAGIKSLELLWTTTERRHIFPITMRTLVRVAVKRDFLLETGGFQSLIERNLPYQRLEQAPVPIHIVTTDFLSGEMVVLSSGPAAEAIVASCSIPAAFAAVAIGKRHLVDGGLVSNTPIKLARDLGANRLIVLPTGHACALRLPPRGAIASALHGLTLLVAGQIVKELETLDAGCDFHVVPSLCPVGTSAYDFTHTRALIDRAEQQTCDWLTSGGLDRCDIPDALRPHSHF
jgi:NTE family protein